MGNTRRSRVRNPPGAGVSHPLNAEAKDKALEELLTSYIDSLVDAYYDARPTGQELADLIESVTVGSKILGVDHLAQLDRRTL